MSEAENLFAGDLWPGTNFADPAEQYRAFFGNARHALKNLIQGIILHQQIIVPTDNFMCLTALLDVFGEESVLDMLDDGILRFIRVNRGIAYCGNGAGLQAFSVLEKSQVPRPPFGALDDAIKWAVSGLGRPIRNPSLLSRAAAATAEIDLETPFNDIRHETYMDVLNSPYLRALFSVRNTELQRLSGIEANQVRTYDSCKMAVPKDEIETVLVLCRANLEMFLASNCSCCELLSKVVFS